MGIVKRIFSIRFPNVVIKGQQGGQVDPAALADPTGTSQFAQARIRAVSSVE
jgi:hypothetical protein